MSNSSRLGRRSLFPLGDSISTTPHDILEGSWDIWYNLARAASWVQVGDKFNGRGYDKLHVSVGIYNAYQFFDFVLLSFGQ
jgi:hypothetical protein